MKEGTNFLKTHIKQVKLQFFRSTDVSGKAENSPFIMHLLCVHQCSLHA